jgi:hypothetical protein
MPVTGIENNKDHPMWGGTGVDLMRLTPAAYTDGISSPAGNNRPSARLISNTVSLETEEESGEDGPRNNRNQSDWVYGWGQFVDHDLDLTTSGNDSFNISVPTGDQYFDPSSTGEELITLKRSNFDPASGTGTTLINNQEYKLTLKTKGSQ